MCVELPVYMTIMEWLNRLVVYIWSVKQDICMPVIFRMYFK